MSAADISVSAAAIFRMETSSCWLMAHNTLQLWISWLHLFILKVHIEVSHRRISSRAVNSDGPCGLTRGQQVDEPVCSAGNVLLASVAQSDGSRCSQLVVSEEA